MNLFVIIIEVAACCIGYARHGSEDERDGSGWWDSCSGRVWGLVEEGENALDCSCEGIGGDYCREEVLRSCMLEITDFKAERREGEG